MGQFEIVSNTGKSVSNADYIIPPKLTQTQIDVLVSIPIGAVVFNTTVGKQQIFNGTIWEDVATGSSGGSSQVKLVNQSGNITALSVAGISYYYSFSALGELTLPTAVGNTSIYQVKNASTVNITVVFTGGQNADGSTSILMIPNQSLTFISNNTNYDIN